MTPRRNVAIVMISDLFSKVDGITNYYRHLLKYAKPNINLHFIMLSNHKTEVIEKQNHTLIYFKEEKVLDVENGLYVLLNPLRFLSVKKRITHLLKKFNIDVVQIIASDPFSMLAAKAARSLSLPVVGTYHTRIPEYTFHWLDNLNKNENRLLRCLHRSCLPILKWWDRKVYRLVDHLIAPNSAMKTYLTKNRYGFKVTIIGRGVDANDFVPLKKQKKAIVLYVGRVSKEKMLDDLDFLNTIADISIRIVGSGDYTQQLQMILPTATFTGVLTGSSLFKEYGHGDIFVFPSKTDTFANTVLEAMSAGIAVVAYDQEILKDRIEDGETGLLVHTKSEFKDAVCKLLTDKKLRTKLQKQARKKALRFNWKDVCEKQQRIYECM